MILYSLTSLEEIQEVCLNSPITNNVLTDSFQNLIKDLFTSRNPVDASNLIFNYSTKLKDFKDSKKIVQYLF